MIFAAKVKGAGTTAGTYLVSPLYTRIDGLVAPDIEALPVNSLIPAVDDIVYCAEGINDFTPATQLLINDNGGAFPLIFASLAGSIQIGANVTLGQGGKKMVLGDDLAAWAQAVDAALQALYTWGDLGTGSSGSIPKFPGVPALQTWEDTNLSENHKLD